MQLGMNGFSGLKRCFRANRRDARLSLRSRARQRGILIEDRGHPFRYFGGPQTVELILVCRITRSPSPARDRLYDVTRDAGPDRNIAPKMPCLRSEPAPHRSSIILLHLPNQVALPCLMTVTRQACSVLRPKDRTNVRSISGPLPILSPDKLGGPAPLSTIYCIARRLPARQEVLGRPGGPGSGAGAARERPRVPGGMSVQNRYNGA